MGIANKKELAEYCMGRKLIYNFSFYPTGIAKKILKNYNFDKFKEPCRPGVDHAGLLTLADAVIYLATTGDGGRLYDRPDFKEAIKTQRKLVDLYYQFADSILKETGPDYSLTFKYITEFKVEFEKFKNYNSVYLDVNTYTGMINFVEKEVTKLYVQQQLKVLQELGKNFISEETWMELDELEIESFEDKAKMKPILYQVRDELQQNSAPSPVLNVLYNILKFFNIEKSSVFKGFFNQQRANDVTQQISKIFQEDSDEMDENRPQTSCLIS
ncbi:hypothetical protein [Legionella sp. WA2022007384]